MPPTSFFFYNIPSASDMFIFLELIYIHTYIYINRRESSASCKSRTGQYSGEIHSSAIRIYILTYIHIMAGSILGGYH